MGWNGSGQKGAAPVQPKVTTKKPSPVRGLVAGAVAVVVGIVCIFAFSGKSEKPVEKGDKERGRIKEVTPAAAPKAVEELKPEVADPRAARREKMKNMTPDQRWEFLVEEIKRRPPNLPTTTNKAYRTGTEQIMTWIFTTKPGDLPPPMPKISIHDELHMAEILIANNPIVEGDSESVKNAKEIVALAKKELRDYIKQGGEVEEFLEYYRGQLTQMHNEHVDAMKSVRQIINEDPDIAVEYLNQVNKRLEERGIKPVTLTRGQKARLGIEIEGDDNQSVSQPSQKQEGAKE